MALDGSIDEVTQEDLQQLLDNKVAEKKVIEYKSELKVASDGDRKEFLADVSSLANTAGGHLIFGVSEKDGYPQDVPGIEMPSEDEQIRTLEGMIRDGISPRLGSEIRSIPLVNRRRVLLVRVPFSWSRPHMVTFRGGQRFWARDTRGKYPMDIQQIRTAVLVNESSADRIRNFRVERLALIVAGLTTPPLLEGARFVLHLVPIGAFDAGSNLDVISAVGDTGDLRPIYSSGWSTRPNFDGVVAWDPESDESSTRTYTQLFRNGSVEAAISWPGKLIDDRLLIPSITYEEVIYKALPDLLRLQEKVGVTPPLFLMLSIIGIAGYSLAVSAREDLFGDQGRPLDRNELLLPETVLESLHVDPGKLLKPLFDVVWNSAGFPRSLNFDDEGQWIR